MNTSKQTDIVSITCVSPEPRRQLFGKSLQSPSNGSSLPTYPLVKRPHTELHSVVYRSSCITVAG